jgi:hypothetical protein
MTSADTLTGSCHCGAVRFEVDLETVPGKLRRCNCSLCRRKGAIMSIVPAERFRITRGADKLSLYQWNTRLAKHYFCSVCGIYTHHLRRLAADQYGFNIGCIDAINPFEHDSIEVFDGQSLSVVED